MYLKELDLFNRDEVSFVDKLYVDSFPFSERRPGKSTFDLHRDNPKFIVDLVMENNLPIGFLTYWDLGYFIFAEHFAIVSEARNGGIGGRVISLFIAKAKNRPIILEVELPTTILSERRIGFYQRLGYKLWDNIPYQQPSYHEGGNPIPMKLMSLGDIDLEKSFGEIKDKIYSEVYNS